MLEFVAVVLWRWVIDQQRRSGSCPSRIRYLDRTRSGLRHVDRCSGCLAHHHPVKPCLGIQKVLLQCHASTLGRRSEQLKQLLNLLVIIIIIVVVFFVAGGLLLFLNFQKYPVTFFTFFQIIYAILIQLLIRRQECPTTSLGSVNRCEMACWIFLELMLLEFSLRRGV